MDKLRKALDAIARSLGLQKPLLARARRRYKANRKRAFKFHAQAVKAQEHADVLRAGGSPDNRYDDFSWSAAPAEDRRAARLHHKAAKNHMRAQFWLGRIKVLAQRIHKLNATQAQLEASAELYRQNHGLKFNVEKNKVTGGTDRKRALGAAKLSAARCSSGKRPNHYDQGGAFDVEHCFTGPPYDHRDDCSSWETSCHWSAGLPDPNNEDYKAGYTGTMTRTGKVVSRSALKGGEGVFYGDYPYHHTEMVDDPAKGTTLGHGSAPVDQGIIDLFGPGERMTFVDYYTDK